MFGSQLRCCYYLKNLSSNALDLSNSSKNVVSGIGQQKYSNKSGCCKDDDQIKGRRVEVWPKPDPPPPAWKPECPCEPQPSNYDPYRIKGPEILVPPLKGNPAKEASDVFGSSSTLRDLFRSSPIVHPDYWKEQPEPLAPAPADAPPKLGYHGQNKYKYAFHEPWKPLDRITLLNQAERETVETARETSAAENVETLHTALDCARKSPCSGLPAPPPDPCPPPPRRPFPWRYVIVPTVFFSIMGLAYRYWVYASSYIPDPVLWRPRRKVKKPYNDSDLPPCVQYLIIGTGTAGWAAYKSIMKHDSTAKVFFVTKEDVMPYLRPPMSKFMWWNTEPPDITSLPYLVDGKRHSLYLANCKNFMDPVKFYRKKEGPAVSIASGWCVLRIDPEEHIAYIKTMCGERPMYYERALLAVGSKPKNLSIFTTAPAPVRKKVTTFRTIRDLEIAFRKVKEANHVTIIGGGILGCELAWHLGKMNQLMPREMEDPPRPPLQLVHMYNSAGVLSSILPEYLGEWAAEKIRCEGVTLMPKTTPHDAFMSKDGRLELTLNDGSSFVTDYVFVCIGNKPREEIAPPSFLELDPINGGIAVNTELEARTHLYVAGDAASFYSQWKDSRQRHEHYMSAHEQGTIAGENMAGGWEPCNVEPSFWLRLGETLEMQVVGEVGACMPIIALFKPCRAEDVRKPPPNGLPCYKDADEYQSRYKRGLLCYLRDETIVGFVFWNMPPIDDRQEVATEILRARPSYKDINLVADLLGFPDTHCVYATPEELFVPGPCIKNWRIF